MPEAVIYSTEFRVRYAETDQMGVVYHANYLVWCEIGRTGLLRHLGQSYAEMERSGIVLAVSDAKVRYHTSARYDDLIRVRTRITKLRSRLIEFEYEIARVDEDGSTTRLASASTTLISLDPEGRPRVLPPETIALLRSAHAS
jgi:acyl-CoA thioester hydrolase